MSLAYTICYTQHVEMQYGWLKSTSTAWYFTYRVQQPLPVLLLYGACSDRLVPITSIGSYIQTTLLSTMHLIGQRTNTDVERLNSTIVSTNQRIPMNVQKLSNVANNGQLDDPSPFKSGLYIVHTIMVLFINVLVSKNLTLQMTVSLYVYEDFSFIIFPLHTIQFFFFFGQSLQSFNDNAMKI